MMFVIGNLRDEIDLTAIKFMQRHIGELKGRLTDTEREFWLRIFKDIDTSNKKIDSEYNNYLATLPRDNGKITVNYNDHPKFGTKVFK